MKTANIFSFFRQHPFVFIPFAFYLYTCLPTIGLADPSIHIWRMKHLVLNTHSNSHNIFTLSGWLFQHLPFESIAYKANLVSVAYGTVTVALFYRLVFLMFRSRLQAAVAALFLMVNHSMWWNSTIAENYAPNAFFVVLWLYLLYKTGENYKDKYLYGIFFIAGLSLSQHNQLGILFIGALISLAFRLRKMKEGRARLVLISFGWFFLGVLPHLIFFIRDLLSIGDFRRAVMNALIGGFESASFKTPFSFRLITDAVEVLWMEFPSPYLLCIFNGLLILLKKRRFDLLVPLLVGIGMTYWAFTFFMNVWDQFCFLLPNLVIYTFFGAYGIHALFDYVGSKRSLLWKLSLGAVIVGSLAWPVYFYQNVSRWAQNPKSYFYKKWNDNFAINTHRVSEYILNPNKRHYYDVEEFCELALEKLPDGAILYDSDSRTHYSFKYFQDYYQKGLHVDVRLFNSWWLANWGDSEQDFGANLKRAYEQDRDFFLVSLGHPFNVLLHRFSTDRRYRFEKFPLDERRWVYRLVTASQAGEEREVFNRWEELDPAKPISVDLKESNVLYAWRGLMERVDTSPFGDFWKNNDQVFFGPADPPTDSEIGFLFRLTRPAVLDLKINFMTARDFGIYDVYLNTGKIGTFDLYTQNEYPRLVEIKGVSFEKGNNILRFKPVGKNFESSHYKMGIDTIEWRESILPANESGNVFPPVDQRPAAEQAAPAQ
ncbi:MAG: DUF2723 domain-containing protein [Candidatus Omnitrophica bacterium]|nr:DUF2723 domain-containing protein [Candidatus Omnitrophota bacterium]